MAEFKYDGERVQAHKKGQEVSLFSRRLENITGQYPDAVRMFKTHVKAEDAILEAECVAVDPTTGEIRPFQELMHRRRKHAVQQAAEEYPVALFVFDVIQQNDITLVLNTQRQVKLNPHKLFIKNDCLYMRMGDETIKFAEQALMKIAPLLEVEHNQYYIRLKESDYRIPALDDL